MLIITPGWILRLRVVDGAVVATAIIMTTARDKTIPRALRKGPGKGREHTM
jgi:hypothetical protein